jgi:hypothetical protein
MLRIIDIGIENATAFCILGKITKTDMSVVLLNAKEKTEHYGNIVIYEEIQGFEGIELSAVIEEFKYLFEIGISNISKVAVVTDKDWIMKIASLEAMIFRNIDIKCFQFTEKALAIEFLKKA